MTPAVPVNRRAEVVGGLTTFFTMAYIVVVNPAILSTEGTGMPFSGVLTATVLLCFALTLMMGLYAKLPYAVAPGMGINAFFTYTIVLTQKVPWPVALGIVFWAGVLFIVVSVTPLRVTVTKAIPQGLRIGSAAGIGIFLTFIGLKNCGFVKADPVTFVRFGGLSKEVLLALLGFGIMVWLRKKRNPFAFLAGIFAVTALAWLLGLVRPPERIVSPPDFQSVFLKLDVLGALSLAYLPAILSIMFTDFFDSISTFIGVAQASGFKDGNGDPKNLKEGLVVDAFATMGAGLAGTSSGTAYIESASGIDVGARTGLASVVTALCFVPCFFLSPLAAMVPDYATAPVLILVGSLMFRSILDLELEHMENSLPAFLTIVLIPLTFSITQGLLWGFISHVVLYLVAGRRRELHPMMYALAAVSIGLLVLEHRAGV
jgi:AGZA family xanthine/uracil permease-like MFS transporter